MMILSAEKVKEVFSWLQVYGILKWNNKVLGEVALFVLPLGWLVRRRQNKICHLCGCHKIKKQKMRGGKK
jgi:hypothetical protein